MDASGTRAQNTRRGQKRTPRGGAGRSKVIVSAIGTRIHCWLGQGGQCTVCGRMTTLNAQHRRLTRASVDERAASSPLGGSTRNSKDPHRPYVPPSEADGSAPDLARRGSALGSLRGTGTIPTGTRRKSAAQQRTDGHDVVLRAETLVSVGHRVGQSGWYTSIIARRSCRSSSSVGRPTNHPPS